MAQYQDRGMVQNRQFHETLQKLGYAVYEGADAAYLCPTGTIIDVWDGKFLSSPFGQISSMGKRPQSRVHEILRFTDMVSLERGMRDLGSYEALKARNYEALKAHLAKQGVQVEQKPPSLPLIQCYTRE